MGYAADCNILDQSSQQRFQSCNTHYWKSGLKFFNTAFEGFLAVWEGDAEQ
jgi:hypothetical protein